MTWPEADRRLAASVDRAVRRAVLKELAWLVVTAGVAAVGVMGLMLFAPEAREWVVRLAAVAAAALVGYGAWALLGYARVLACEDEWDEPASADAADLEDRQGGGEGEH